MSKSVSSFSVCYLILHFLLSASRWTFSSDSSSLSRATIQYCWLDEVALGYSPQSKPHWRKILTCFNPLAYTAQPGEFFIDIMTLEGRNIITDKAGAKTRDIKIFTLSPKMYRMVIKLAEKNKNHMNMFAGQYDTAWQG